MKKFFIAVVALLLALLAGFFAWTQYRQTQKVSAPKNALLEGVVPTSFDPKECGALIDPIKIPASPITGSLYREDKLSAPITLTNGIARKNGDRLEISMFEGKEKQTCQTSARPVLQFSLDKVEPGNYKYDIENFSKNGQPLEYMTWEGERDNREASLGLVVLSAIEAKAGGQVKGKGAFCFLRPDAKAVAASSQATAPVPPDQEEPEAAAEAPKGTSYALAGEFAVEFCP